MIFRLTMLEGGGESHRTRGITEDSNVQIFIAEDRPCFALFIRVDIYDSIGLKMKGLRDIIVTLTFLYLV
jgi:hypothetical protein